MTMGDEWRDDLLDELDVGEALRADAAPTTARVAFATIEALTLVAQADFRDALVRSLVRGTRIERHNRAWRMGPVHEEDGVIVGRIGYEAGSLAEVWDDALADFREEQLPAGLTSPFAIDVGRARVAFQLRTGQIRVRSFTGALESLMNQASPTDRWRVGPAVRTIPLERWVRTVDRVIRLRVVLNRPNPHYGDRKSIERVIEGANARMAEVVWQSDADNLKGLDLDDEFVQEAVRHTKKYGRAKAVGEKHGVAVTWDSATEGASEERVALTDPKTREVHHADLRTFLTESELETDQDAAPADDEEERGNGS
jgi:hypothetical protein